MEAQRAFKATFPTAGRDASLEPLFGSFLADQKGTPRRGGERDWVCPQTISRNGPCATNPADRRKSLAQPKRKTPKRALRQLERAPAHSLRCSQKHPTGMFLMGSPCVPLAPARRAFQLQTAAAVCHQKTRRPSSRVPPSVQGGGLPSFFLYRKKKEAKKRLPSEKHFAPCGERPKAPPLETAALTGRFASLRARGLRPAFEKA